MSLGAKNSLLKIVEEPPRNAYFILTLEQLENTLPTIRSRCVELRLDEYTLQELQLFIYNKHLQLSSEENDILLKCCLNNYHIDLFIKYGIMDFYNFVYKVYENISKVQSANAFKLAEKLNLKDEDDKYDLRLFLLTFIRIISINFDAVNVDKTIIPFYCDILFTTYDTLKDLKINGINKQCLIDMWILDIRKIWRRYYDYIGNN